MSRVGNGYVYCSDYVSEDEAENEFRAYLGEDSTDAKALHLRWNPGRIENHWKKNCVAIGLSQGFLEPLEAAMLNVIKYSVEGFVTAVSKGGFSETSRTGFNDKVNTLIDDIRDYLQLHYKLNTREDTTYWRDVRANEHMSERLAEIVETWDSSAHFDSVMKKQSPIQAYKRTSWYCMLSGMGRFNAPNRQAKGSPEKYIDWLHQQCAVRAEQFHLHSDYLQKIHGKNDSQ